MNKVYIFLVKIKKVLSYIFCLHKRKQDDNCYYFIDSWIRKSVKRDYEPFLSQDITDDYLNLIRNLDAESLRTVVVIINRIQKLIRSKYRIKKFERLPSEINLKKEVDEQCNYSSVKCNHSVYACKHFLFPFEMTYETFFFKHGLMYLIQKIDVCDRVRNGTIIDAGAYVGDSAVMFSEITERVIYAFEPISSNYQLLMKTIELNGLNNKIIAIEKGLGDKDEIIYTNAEKEGSMLTLSNSSDNSQIKHNTIQMTTLDNFVAEHNISVDLIKVDVEGFEQKFLSGALQTIKKYKPVILLSIYHNASDFFKLKPMLEELNIGYEFIIRHLHPTNFYADTMLICWPTQLK